jgi:hypothetical protein
VVTALLDWATDPTVVAVVSVVAIALNVVGLAFVSFKEKR